MEPRLLVDKAGGLYGLENSCSNADEISLQGVIVALITAEL